MSKNNEKQTHIHMTREQYLSQLRKYLKKLPREDYENAMEYFTEYFDEVGPEGEADLIQELGTPKEAAYDLLDNLITEKKKEPGTPIWVIISITILALFAAPIGGSLAIGGIAILLHASSLRSYASYVYSFWAVQLSGSVLRFSFEESSPSPLPLPALCSLRVWD